MNNKPRKMRNKSSGQVVTVHSWAMTRGNAWEYYFLDKNSPAETRFALVFGFETEMGDVYMPEIKPRILSATADLSELAPCNGWEWVD